MTDAGDRHLGLAVRSIGACSVSFQTDSGAVNERRSSERILLLSGFAVTIALSPIPLGSNRDWAWAPLGVALGLFLLISALLVLWKSRSFSRTLPHIRNLALPAGLVVIVLLWGFLQLSGVTPASWATPIVAGRGIGGGESSPAMAFNVESGLVGELHLLSYLASFVLAAVLPQSATEVRRFLGGLIWSGVLTTVCAMIAVSANHVSRYTGVSIWVPNPDTYFSGSFVNSNNYATYAGILALAAFALAVEPPRGAFRESASQRWRRRLNLVVGKSGLWLIAAMILTTGVLLAASRGAWLGFVAGWVAVVLFYTQGRQRAAAVLVVLFVLAMAAVLMPGGAHLLGKVARLAQEGEHGREMAYALTFDAIGLRPYWGWGLNSFADLYWIFQRPSEADFFDKAHSTYLELAVDLGIPMTVAIQAAILWVAAWCGIGFYQRRRDRELAGLGVFVTLLVGIHATVDFSLQIPGMACTYFAILGLAWNQSWSSNSATAQ